MSATPEQVLEWAEAYQGHDNAEGRGDNENCKWCDAWSDDDWRKPCPKSPRLMAAALIRAQAERVRVLEEREQVLVDALHDVGIGGNHAALLIGSRHPLYTASDKDARAHYGKDLDGLNAWHCWRAIMKAMREAYDTLPEDVRNAAWKRMEERRRAALKGEA